MPNHPKVDLSDAQLATGSVPILEAGARANVPWTKPVLISYGDVRQLTMGGSPGIGDSGNPGAQQLP